MGQASDSLALLQGLVGQLAEGRGRHSIDAPIEPFQRMDGQTALRLIHKKTRLLGGGPNGFIGFVVDRSQWFAFVRPEGRAEDRPLEVQQLVRQVGESPSIAFVFNSPTVENGAELIASMATRDLNSGLWLRRLLVSGSPHFRCGTTSQRLTMGPVQKNQISSLLLLPRFY